MINNAFQLVASRPHPLTMDDGSVAYEIMLMLVISQGNIVELVQLVDDAINRTTNYSSRAYAQFEGNDNSVWMARYTTEQDARYADYAITKDVMDTLNCVPQG